jgi:predicted DNA-binding transcriptional regulator AlpA
MTGETVQTVVTNPKIASNSQLIDTIQLAGYLGNEVNTCEGWRLKGIGPRYIKVGRLVRYRIEIVDQWLESQTRNSTCEA